MTAATAEGTKRYVERMIARGALKSSYRVLGKTGLHVSLVGFGTYRVSTREPEQREALRKALLEGCNLIDTSTNYMDGGAESLIGEVLAELFESGDLQRDEVVVVSKIGYVQGSNLVLAERRETQKRPY